VASAAANNEQHEVYKVYYVAVRTALYMGGITAVVFACLSPVLASYFLGETGEAWWFIVAALGLIGTPLLTVELAFLQGLQQSKSLALCQVLASVIGSILTIVLVLLYKIDGAVFALVTMVLASVFVHHKFVKKHLPQNVSLQKDNFIRDSCKLLRMGSAFALNGIWITVAGYLNILFLTSYYGPSAATHQVGLNGAAMMLASVYINIIISAMGTEFYPRLIAAAQDRSKLNELLNQQTRLSIAIGIPVSAGLLLFAPWVLRGLYSPEFVDATEPMRWLILGMVVRFITCPLGFCVYAACKPRTIAINELLTGGTMIAISYLTISTYGLKGVGIGLTLANLLYMIGIAIFMWTQKIRWEARTIFKAVVVMAVCSGILAILIFSASWWAFFLCAGIIALLSLLLFNGLRKESDITWEVIRKKLMR
jgi:PST family polysaccharide transporter